MLDSYNNFESFTNDTNIENYNDTNLTTVWTNEEFCSPVSAGSLLSTPIFQFCVFFMYCTIFIVALIGNGLVCFVVLSSPRMKTVTNYFIMNLAIGDILMTIFCVPFSFVSMLVLRYWPFGIVMCKIVNYSQAVSVLVSAYTLLAISIDRYIAIMRPLQPRLGKTAAKIIVAAVWGGALATAAPIIIVSQIQRPTEWHQYCKTDICLEKWEFAEQNEQYSCALLVLQFGLPLTALVCTYARIAHVVWGVRPPGEAQTARDTRIQHSKRKMIKMMVTVVIVFTICWLPLNIFIILWTLHETDDAWATWPGMPYVWFVAHWLAMSHCCYNPIIYSYMNVRYRRGFKQILGSLMPTRLHQTSRSARRTSTCDVIPLSELIGVNGINRREVSSGSGRLQRVSRRGGNSDNNLSSRHFLASTLPIQALSIRRQHQL